MAVKSRVKQLEKRLRGRGDAPVYIITTSADSDAGVIEYIVNHPGSEGSKFYIICTKDEGFKERLEKLGRQRGK